MSAYIVSDATIHYLVSAAVEYKCLPWFLRSEENIPQALTECLLQANYDSVNHRYHGDDKPHALKHKSIIDLCPKIVFSQVKHFDYQACEVDNFNSSEVSQFLNNLRDSAFNALLGSEKDSLPWDLDDDKLKESNQILIGAGGLSTLYEYEK